MKRFKAAAIIMMIHAVYILVGSLIFLPMLMGGSKIPNLDQYSSFIMPFLTQNLYLMLILGRIYSIIYFFGALGLLRNKKWGITLSIINCIMELIWMFLMMPAGLIDGALASVALILILSQYFKDRKSEEQEDYK